MISDIHSSIGDPHNQTTSLKPVRQPLRLCIQRRGRGSPPDYGHMFASPSVLAHYPAGLEPPSEVDSEMAIEERIEEVLEEGKKEEEGR